MAKNIYHKIIDTGQKLGYQTDAEFNTKIKCITRNVLVFLPVSNFIDGFIHLTDNDDLPQLLVSHFETRYIGGEKAKSSVQRVEPPLPTQL